MHGWLTPLRSFRAAWLQGDPTGLPGASRPRTDSLTGTACLPLLRRCLGNLMISVMILFKPFFLPSSGTLSSLLFS